MEAKFFKVGDVVKYGNCREGVILYLVFPGDKNWSRNWSENHAPVYRVKDVGGYGDTYYVYQSHLRLAASPETEAVKALVPVPVQLELF